MCADRMHADEVETDVPLVRRLVASQFPRWAALPVEPVASSGTDNAMYRLGDNLAVRLPRTPGAVDGVATEQRWLPRLAPRLPVAAPVPLAAGRPGQGYPWPWTVQRWLDGENPVAGRLADASGLARDLAAWVTALRRVAPSPDAPAASRGVPLARRDGPTRRALRELGGAVDTRAALAAWEQAVRLPEWHGAPSWLHGDLSPGNVLVADGRLRAVIDFGGTAGVGDPTADLIVAWNLLPAHARPVFREALGADDAVWGRARGWALSIALIQLPYYRTTNPALAANSRLVIREVLAEHGSGTPAP
jgi:aminoglycoside phosphotransferase (APT) family kinase protein